MTREQGITASLVVVLGAFLKSAFVGAPPPSNPLPPSRPAATSQAPSAAKPATVDGPWRASCNYWEPSHRAPAATPTDDADSACGSKNWGLPTQALNTKDIPITALIATVPDPIHSGMPLEFDRTIDVLTQAASEYGYVASFFWLPWRNPPSNSSVYAGSPSAETDDDFQREKQPGLLILRQSYAVPENTPLAPGTSPWGRRVVYLFLVGQSPALGVNGDQLQNAIQYELYLQKNFGAALSFKSTDAADIIGPNSSGAAASLRAALDTMPFPGLHVSVAGITSTTIAKNLLNGRQGSSAPIVQYLSFGDNSEFDQDKLTTLFERSLGARGARVAFLGESGTIFGINSLIRSFAASSPAQDTDNNKRLPILFPRDISLLRNAQKEGTTPADASAAAAVSPYLHLSLKDSSVEDSIPPFSPQKTEYSQEAQWIAIVRELKQHNIGVVAVSASNILDELFLIKSLHRDVPDATVVVYDGGDLLFTRVGDNEDFVGDVTFTAYPLVSLSPSSGSSPQLHNFADSLTEGLFNAASYTFWRGDNPRWLHLVEYANPLNPHGPRQPPLWATAVGRDGYYPLGIANDCPSDNSRILPSVPVPQKPIQCQSSGVNKATAIPQVEGTHPGTPSFSWYLLCTVITALCLAHSLVLYTANFWSPMTRDLSIADGDQPRRRSVYVHIAVAVLFAMSFIASFPIIPVWHLLRPDKFTCAVALITFFSGLLAVCATLRRTWPFLWRKGDPSGREDAACIQHRKVLVAQEGSETVFYRLFNLLAALTAILVPLVWMDLCLRNYTANQNTYVGLFFSYRCLYPASGICPLLPVLLILLTWYIWALFQAKRLRFSENNRPLLPSAPEFGALRRFYVSDDSLAGCSRPTDSCLYENVTCLLITRQLIRRSFTLHPKQPPKWLNPALIVLYLAFFALFVLCFRVQGLDRFFRPHHVFPAPYELLICALFYPLLVIAMAGAIRMVFIWSSLNRGLLTALERSPLRFAFSRISDVGWMTMLRQGGVFEYWRDLVRSIESIQQLSNLDDIRKTLYSADPGTLSVAEEAQARLGQHILSLLALIGGQEPKPATDELVKPQQNLNHILEVLDCYCKGAQDIECREVDNVRETRQNFLIGSDLPSIAQRRPLNLMCAIECEFATYAKCLLSCVLIPYWLTESKSPVEGEPAPAGKADTDKSKSASTLDPDYIQLAAEFVVIRYLSLIRAVLINLRFLMTFVSASFVLALIAWNSYPFQPRQWVDWTFTFMLFGIGAAVIWVFAQMHRNPILSRITGTNINELGSAFFLRLFTFGAVPFLTWVASQFPSISNWISRLLQSGLMPAK